VVDFEAAKVSGCRNYRMDCPPSKMLTLSFNLDFWA
jgi:hypothetical protein